MRVAYFDQLVAVRERERPDPNRVSVIVPPGHLLYIRGWAVSDEGTSFYIRVDDGEATRLTTGLARPDVVEALGDEDAGFSGFEAFIDTTELALGEHTVKIFGSMARADQALASSSFQVGKPWPRTTLQWRSGGANVWFDSITIGDVAFERFARSGVMSQDDILKMSGWVFNGLENKTGIAAYIIIDDSEAIRLRYGIERGDVADAHAQENIRYCGFRGALNLGAWGPGLHLLRVVVLMADGSAVASPDSLMLRVI